LSREVTAAGTVISVSKRRFSNAVTQTDDDMMNERVDSLNRFERTLDVQIDLINEIDNKASNVVRYTVILIGAIFTGVSVIPRSGVVSLDDIGSLPRFLFFIGVISLIIAVCSSIITYLSNVQYYGPDPAYGQNVADKDISSPEYEEVLLSGYSDAVEANRQVIDTNARRFRWSLASLFFGIVYSALAGGIVAVNTVPWGEVVIVGIVTMIAIPSLYMIITEEFLVLERKTKNDE
jgi:hypothetical protein